MRSSPVSASALGSWLRPATVVVALLVSTACHDSVMAPIGAAYASLTVWNSSPQDGNGTLAPGATAVAYYTDQGFDDLDRVTVSGQDSTGTAAHDMEIYWNPVTTEVRLVQHFWGPVGGATSAGTRCAAGTGNTCDQATMSLDLEARTLTFDGTVLQDFLGGDATSTVTGFVRWGIDQSDGGDH